MRNPNRQTAIATRQFFEWLEQRFGSGPLLLPMMDYSSKVVTRNSLQAADLQNLFEHKITALHIPNFYPRASAIQLGHDLSKKVPEAKNWKVGTSNGLESSDVFTLGKHDPYNIAFANQTLDDYFAKVPQEFQDHRRRQRCNNSSHDQEEEEEEETAKILWPLDLLRLELDQVWPQGAGLARGGPENNRFCRGGGLTRIMMGPTRWKKGFIHVDELAPLSTNTGTFSANIYLQLPSQQQQQHQPIMELWPLGIYSKWDWYRNASTLSSLSSQDAEGQIRLRRVLGEPFRLEAEPGDLILLCVQRPHCAIGFSTPDIRVSLQCFLQYEGSDQRLAIES